MREKKLYFHDYIRIENTIWFSCVDMNGLFSYDIANGELKLKAVFPQNLLQDTFMHMKMFKYKNNLMFVPFQGKYLYIYDIKKETMKAYAVDDEVKYSHYMTGVQDDNNVYLFPCRSRYIIKVNIETGRQSKILEINKKWGDSTLPYGHKAIDLHDNNLVIAPYQCDFVQIVDFDGKEKERIELSEAYNGITHLKVLENNILVVGKEGKVGMHSWDGKCIQKAQLKKECGNCKYYDVEIVDLKLYMTENDHSRIAVYNMESNQISEINIAVKGEKKFPLFWGNMLFLKKTSKNTIETMSAHDGYIYIINTDLNRVVEKRSIWVSNVSCKKELIEQMGGVFPETYLSNIGIDGLPFFLSGVVE